MEFNSQWINQPYPPRIPPPSNYESFPDQFSRETGHIQNDFYRDHHHQLPLPPPFRPHDRREAIEIEIEKERIREEIIMHEIRRMLRLEDKAKRDLMMESESALQRGGDVFPFLSSPKMEFKSPTVLPLAHGRSLEDKNAISSWKEKIRLYGGLQSEPFNANRGESISGLKRKAAVVVASELPPNHILMKKVQKMF